MMPALGGLPVRADEPPPRADAPPGAPVDSDAPESKAASEATGETPAEKAAPAAKGELEPETAAAPPEAAAPVTPEPRVPIVGYEIQGQHGDPDDRLQALAAAVSPPGTPFVPSGPADQVGGKPIGTVPRLRQAFEQIGYRADVATRPAAGGVTVTLTLARYDRLRYIFVSGNGVWVRQDEIQRRISVRPGRVLAPEGPERDADLERERGRVIDFLRGEGYFDANVRLDARRPPKVDGAIDFDISIELGAGYPLGPVAVVGNTAISRDEIEKAIRHGAFWKLWLGPAPFSQKRLREDIDGLVKRYRALGYLGARITTDFNPDTSVDTAAKNVKLLVTVHERKRITIAFEGNKSKSASTLRDEVTLVDRGSYDDYEMSSSADALQRYYQKNGHFFARVDWRRERLTADEERVVFMVDEGPELKVRGVEFAGNARIKSSTLAGVVSVRKYPFLGIGSGGYVTGRQLEQDAERLEEYYRSLGYLEATAHGEAATSPEALGEIGAVAAAAGTQSRDAKAIYVRFTVEEGARVMLQSESFETDDGSPLPYDQKFLLESVSLRPGEPFTPPVVREDGRRLERLLGDAGYPAGTAEPDTDRQGDQVKLTWRFKLGKQARVGPVFVRGNFVTKDDTILEWVPLRTGGLLTTTGIERGQRNLGFLQLFNNASPISFPGRDDQQASVPMVVEVEERYEQFNVLHLGAGVSTDQKPPDSSLPFGFFVRAGYDNRNLFGYAWNVTSSLALGNSLVRGNVGFLDRRFFGTLFRLDASLNYERRATVRLGDVRFGGGSIGFSREMYPGIDAGVHYNLRNTTHTEFLLRGAGPDEAQQSIQLGTTVGSVSFNVEWLRMDNRLLPTKGFRVDAFAEFALPELSAPVRLLPFPIGDDTFIKLGVHSLSVVPLGKYLFLRFGFRFDNGFPLGGASVLPKVERYFAGGDTTIRGFRLDRARIQVVDFPLYPGGLTGVEYRPIGGNLRILQNIDLQFPISPPWYGSVFMDNGVVADSLEGLTVDKFRHSVGVSPLLLRIPVGDLSFAWAWPLDPGPGDTKIGVFHVNIGLMF